MTESGLAAAVKSGEMPWPCWIEIDLDAIRHNVRAVRGLVGSRTSIAAVVKAQAYGHGAVEVARAAVEAGATWLVVARAREGVQLRRAGLEAPILILGPVESMEIDDVVAFDLRPTIVDGGQARLYSAAAVAAGKDVPVHVKLDTGLSRYGIPLPEARTVAREVQSLQGLRFEGFYSHFATADEPDIAFAKRQLQSFRDAVAVLAADCSVPSVVHMAASAATLALGESHLDVVRLGISLYGIYPSLHLKDRVDLVPALSMRSRVRRVFDLKPGDSVGYGRTFVAERHLRAGLVPVGYADGLPRSHSNRGALLVRGRRARILGRISMDQCVVDLSDCGEVAEGTEAVIIGSQGTASVAVEDFAAISGTISYETLTTLGTRVPRVYMAGGVPVSVAYLDEGTVSEL